MAQTLRLEYTCTNEEMKQAQSLNLQKQVGGGSKSRTLVIQFLVLIGMLATVSWRVMHEVAPAYRPLFLLAVIGVTAFVYILRKRQRANAARLSSTLEVTETEITIHGPNSNVTMPWTAFGDCLESPELFVLVDRPKRLLLTIPKRAFPSEQWLSWFREQSENRWRLAEQPALQPQAIAVSRTGDCVKIRVWLAFRDYVDRTIASTYTWAFLLFMTGIFAGTGVAAAANPPPDAVFSAAQVFFMFMLPSLLLMIPIVIFVGSVHSWLTNRKYSVPQDVVLSNESIVFSGAAATGTLPWTVYRRYKETPWSFILWNPSTSAWTIFPKRMFTSLDDLDRCRVLLARNLRVSRWFFA
jgi:hypothetical protein